MFGLLNIFVPFIANLKTTNTQKLLDSHVRMKQQTSRDVCQSNLPTHHVMSNRHTARACGSLQLRIHMNARS